MTAVALYPSANPQPKITACTPVRSLLQAKEEDYKTSIMALLPKLAQLDSHYV